MKNALLGFSALSLVVGIGSAGVFFAHRVFSASQSVPVEPPQQVAARDLTPHPIAITERETPQASPDPFRARPLPPADDIPDAGPNDPASTLATTDSATTIAAEDPLPATRYAERPTTAEISPEEQPEPQDAPIENGPRRLTAREPVDRYGRGTTDEATGVVEDNTPQDSPADAADPQSPAPSGDDTAGSDEGTGLPGDPRLSGSQAPTLTIEKIAPPEIQIGKPAKFLIVVRNIGSATAQGVEIHETIPQGTQLLETNPQATRGPQGILVWELGALKPGDEQKVELQLMPTAEGEIGSVATVHFRAEASVRTVSTKPMLAIEVVAPPKVMKGDRVLLKIKLSNPGSGAATGIVVSEKVPQGLSHPSGGELEFELGTLKPGESRELDLSLAASEAGAVTNVISAHADANLQTEAQTALEVIAPQLQVSLAGPKRRYLERNATHNISIANPGTATAKEVDLVAVLPKQLKFVEANNGGQFDAASHSVYWSLEELPPQETGTVTLTTLPIEPGEARLLIKGKAQTGLADQREETVTVEGLAAINFQLSDVNDPIESGGQTTYEIRVTNQGSKAASNVRLVALLPREMKPVSAEGPVRHKIEGQRVVFDPVKQLAPKADMAFTFKAQALEPGDLRVQVQVSSDEIREPVTKEENTRVFGDE